MGEVYRFGPFTLEVGERRLSRGGEALRLSPKAHDVLVALVQHAGRLVTKRESLAIVWPDAFVEEGILTVHIAALRKALVDDKRPARFIETVSRSGYRFIAPVTHQPFDDEAPAIHHASRPGEVYGLVGRGRALLLSGSPFALPEAVSAFRGAIRIDPTYSAAHAGLALARCAEARLRLVPHADAYGEAKASALRALEADDRSADAQVALGAVQFLSEWDWAAAERSLRRALAIDPSHIEALLHCGALLEALGDLEGGMRCKQQALEREPRSPLVRVQIAWAYWYQRCFDEAIAWAKRALDVEPRQGLASAFLSIAYWKIGDLEALLAERLRWAEAIGAAGEELAEVRRKCAAARQAFAAMGHEGLTHYLLEHFAVGDSSRAAVQRAWFYATAGRLDAAFEQLDRALAARDPHLVHLAVAPQWDGLRGDVRFDDRLKAMGLRAAT